MYGNKSLSQYVQGGNHRKMPNFCYYISEHEFKDLYYAKKLSLKSISTLVEYPNSVDQFRNEVNSRKWRSLGRQTYHVNASAFTTWDRDTAWIYGWLLTDGYTHLNSAVGITLQECDLDVLEKIRNILQYEGPIGQNKRDHSYSLVISRNELVSNLYNLGFAKEDKTHKCEIPDNLPKEFMWDLIRGAFEGDGTISVEDNLLRLSICGASVKFLKQIEDFLLSNGIDVSIHTKQNGVLVVRTKNMPSALRWAYFMYNNTTDSSRMHRKYTKFISFIGHFYDTKRVSEDSIHLVELSRQFIAA